MGIDYGNGRYFKMEDVILKNDHNRITQAVMGF